MLSKQKQENQIWKLLLILKSQIKFKQTDPNLPYLIHLARRGMEIVLLGLIQRSNDPEIPLPRDLSLSALFEELFPLCSALFLLRDLSFSFSRTFSSLLCSISASGRSLSALFQELFPLSFSLTDFDFTHNPHKTITIMMTYSTNKQAYPHTRKKKANKHTHTQKKKKKKTKQTSKHTERKNGALLTFNHDTTYYQCLREIQRKTKSAR